MSIDPDVQLFVDAMKARSPSVGDKEFDLFDHVTKRGNYFIHPRGFMIVKISRTEVPFWGVGKKHIDILNATLDNYFLVLLVSSSSGYILDKAAINSNIVHDNWRVSGPDYKVHRPPMSHAFNNVEQCLALMTKQSPTKNARTAGTIRH